MFLLFGGNEWQREWQPARLTGGLNDLKGVFQSEEEAIEYTRRDFDLCDALEWWHVLDSESLVVVAARYERNWLSEIQERIDAMKGGENDQH